MTTLKQGTGRALALLLAGAVLSSCMAHGTVRDIAIDTHPNFIPYDKAFYDSLLSGRAWIFEGVHHPNYRNIVRGFIFSKDGSRIGCLAYKKRNGDPLWLAQRDVKWEVLQQAKLIGAVVRNSYNDGRRPRHLPLFYDPSTGFLAGEVVRHRKGGKDYWIRSERGHVQDTWPRALADACPGLDLPVGMAINEKQTSLQMEELRRQDPDAPIRNFPGSHLRAPGTTGLGASRGAPTTTAEEVEAYLAAQEGNILKSPAGNGFVYARTEGIGEFWAAGEDGAEEEFVLPVRSQGGDKITARIGGREVVYMVGYPFPFRPTGHRHAAFQLTDEFLARPYPRELAFMGEAYADKRFVFHPKGKFSVVDEAGNLVEGPHFAGVWRWTRGTLEMTVRNDPAGSRRVHWRTLAHQLGMRPAVWTQHTPDKID